VRILLDTHALLWWLDGDRRLSQRARRLIDSDQTAVLVSAASAWEICAKFRLGKLPGAAAVATDLMGCLDSQGFAPLSITVDHAQRAGSLPGPHRDPFDRVLIAQSQAEDLPLVTVDPVFGLYGVKVIW
jgi:PIN domain nuclease of toxin-antitoxin system